MTMQTTPSGVQLPAVTPLLAGLIRPHRRTFALVAVFVVLESVIELISPWMAGKVIDTVLVAANESALNRQSMILVSLFAGLGLLSFAHHYLLESAGARLLYDLRDRLFSHLIALAPDFHEGRHVGELLSRLSTDVSIVQRFVMDSLPTGIQSVVSLLGTLLVLIIMHTHLTLVALVAVPPVILIGVWFGTRLEILATQSQDAVADSSSIADEAFSGVRIVQAFTRERHESSRYRSQLKRVLGIQRQTAWMTGLYAGLIQFAGFTAFGVVLWYGGRLIVRGELTPGELTSFLLYTLYVAISIGGVGDLYARYSELKGASAPIRKLLLASSSVQDPPAPVRIKPIRGHITLQNVSFRYKVDERTWALRDINCVIPPGEMMAIVGPSGAGKSTLFSLLLRFFDPTEGVIKVDDNDLRCLRLIDIRSNVAIVPQDVTLFSGTIADNIRYGNLAASFGQVQAAAVAAHADHFIRLFPRAYDEMVGERGVNLSAGQRQRISIARAFVKNAPILLLDEATSALDAESESAIQQALATLWTGRTTLVIAHRLSTIRCAARILVLDGGRVVGCDTHKALYKTNQLYRRYWDLQSLLAVGEQNEGLERNCRDS